MKLWNFSEIGLLILGLVLAGLTTTVVANDAHWSRTNTTIILIILVLCLVSLICGMMAILATQLKRNVLNIFELPCCVFKFLEALNSQTWGIIIEKHSIACNIIRLPLASEYIVEYVMSFIQYVYIYIFTYRIFVFIMAHSISLYIYICTYMYHDFM